MKLLLFADGKVGFDVLSFMSSSYSHDLKLVITTEINKIYQYAQSLGLKVSVFDNEFLKSMDEHHYDLGVLAWWPTILKEPLLSYPKFGFINFHPSLLPYNRGKHYNFWALVEQAPFGVTIHQVDEGVDTGAIIAQRKIEYDWEDNGETLFNKAQKTIVELFCDVYPDIRTSSIRPVPQNSSYGSFHRAGELEEASRIILDKKYTAQNLLNLLRARTFDGHPGCWFENQDGEKFEIKINIERKKMTSEYAKFRNECSVEVNQQGNDNKLNELTANWFVEANANKYSYHFEWLGRPIIQYPQDMVAMQELIWQVKPDLIIETGIAHGGSLIMNASLLAMLELCEATEKGEVLDPKSPKRKVLGIDIDIRQHNKEAILAHPMAARIDMIQGSSIAKDIIEQVYEYAKDYKRILISLDSNHTHEHVLEELKAYASLTSVGSYCVVFDTVIEDMPKEMFPDRPWGPGDNPKTAVWEYLKTHPEFEIDKSIQNKLLITVAPDGFLKRIAD